MFVTGANQRDREPTLCFDAYLFGNKSLGSAHEDSGGPPRAFAIDSLGNHAGHPAGQVSERPGCSGDFGFVEHTDLEVFNRHVEERGDGTGGVISLFE